MTEVSLEKLVPEKDFANLLGSRALPFLALSRAVRGDERRCRERLTRLQVVRGARGPAEADDALGTFHRFDETRLGREVETLGPPFEVHARRSVSVDRARQMRVALGEIVAAQRAGQCVLRRAV